MGSKAQIVNIRSVARRVLPAQMRRLIGTIINACYFGARDLANWHVQHASTMLAVIRNSVASTKKRSKPDAVAREASASHPLFDGNHSRRWWATRDAETSSAEGYWNQRTFPARTLIARAIEPLDGSTILEIGCHAGPNLWAVAQRKRLELIAGTELSRPVIEFARDHLPKALGQPVHLVEAAADGLPFPAGSFDIVLTSMVLQCIGPERIEPSLREILRVARRWLILAEPFEGDVRYATAPGRPDPYPNTMYWIRNYAGMLRDRAHLISTVHVPIDQRIGHLDSILVFAAGSRP
jgi:hypothetical protein